MEVIATSVEDALMAEEYGADRIELIAAMTEGGLTPPFKLVQEVVSAVRIPVHVMIRPHSQSFTYNQSDIGIMLIDIERVISSGAAGVVVGALTEDNAIDELFLEQVLPITGGVNVTFHRAFDELNDRLAGLTILQRYPQISRVLTSGGTRSALQAMSEISALVKASKDRSVGILAGHGLTIEEIETFIATTGVSEVHFGSAIRKDGSAMNGIDPLRLQTLVSKLRNMG